MHSWGGGGGGGGGAAGLSAVGGLAGQGFWRLGTQGPL